MTLSSINLDNGEVTLAADSVPWLEEQIRKHSEKADYHVDRVIAEEDQIRVLRALLRRVQAGEDVSCRPADLR